MVEINEGMSELLDKQVDIQNEKSENRNSGVHASPRKVCDENERRIRRLPCKKFIRLYQKTGWADFNEPTLNEGTNSLINERIWMG